MIGRMKAALFSADNFPLGYSVGTLAIKPVQDRLHKCALWMKTPPSRLDLQMTRATMEWLLTSWEFEGARDYLRARADGVFSRGAGWWSFAYYYGFRWVIVDAMPENTIDVYNPDNHDRVVITVLQ